MQQLYALVNRDWGCLRVFDNSSHLKQPFFSKAEGSELNKSQLIYLFFIYGYGHLLSFVSQGSSERGCGFVYKIQNGFL